MGAWMPDADQYQHQDEDIGQLTPWRIIADMLMAGRVYE